MISVTRRYQKIVLNNLIYRYLGWKQNKDSVLRNETKNLGSFYANILIELLFKFIKPNKYGCK